MMLASPCTVRVEKPGSALVDTMKEMRAWLDHAVLEPVDFKIADAGFACIAFDVTFRSEADASLFRQEFC